MDHQILGEVWSDFEEHPDQTWIDRNWYKQIVLQVNIKHNLKRY